MSIDLMKSEVRGLLARTDVMIADAMRSVRSGSDEERVRAAGHLPFLRHRKAQFEARLDELNHSPQTFTSELISESGRSGCSSLNTSMGGSMEGRGRAAVTRRFAPFLAAPIAATLMMSAVFANSKPAPVQSPEFNGAVLGMTLDQWKALPNPSGAGEPAIAACSAAGDPASPRRVAGSSVTSAPTVVCAYVERDRDETRPLWIPISKHYFARGPRYWFVGGRLSRIEFQSSIDAFNDVMAAMKSKYGPATTGRLDTIKSRDGLDLDRVQEVWRLSGGTIRMTDPSPRPDELTVRMSRRDEGPLIGSPVAGDRSTP